MSDSESDSFLLTPDGVALPSPTKEDLNSKNDGAKRRKTGGSPNRDSRRDGRGNDDYAREDGRDGRGKDGSNSSTTCRERDIDPSNRDGSRPKSNHDRSERDERQQGGSRRTSSGRGSPRRKNDSPRNRSPRQSYMDKEPYSSKQPHSSTSSTHRYYNNGGTSTAANGGTSVHRPSSSGASLHRSPTDPLRHWFETEQQEIVKSGGRLRRLQQTFRGAIHGGFLKNAEANLVPPKHLLPDRLSSENCAPKKARKNGLTPKLELVPAATSGTTAGKRIRNGSGQYANLESGSSSSSSVSPSGIHPIAFSRRVVSFDRYEKIEEVGKGQYGKVWKARDRETGQIVAAKLTTKVASEQGGVYIAFMREVQVLQRVRNNSACVKMLGIAVDKGFPVIIMEYCNASLQQLLQSDTHPLVIANVKYLMRQILEGVRHMHSLGILHRDIASKNILFNVSGEIKVCDFGISRMGFGAVGSDRSPDSPKAGAIDTKDESCLDPKRIARASNFEPPNLIVTPPYRSIELLLGEQKYGPPLDVWSVGCILAEALLMRGGVAKRPFFYPTIKRESAERPGEVQEENHPNPTPQLLASYILQILGRPSTEGRNSTWPEFKDLIRHANFENFESQIRSARQHRGPRGSNEEGRSLQDYFTRGEGRNAQRSHLRMKESLFDLLGKLLCLNPADRATASGAMKHGWFEEEPLPHWNKALYEGIAKDVGEAAADTVRAQREREKVLRELNVQATSGGTVVSGGRSGQLGGSVALGSGAGGSSHGGGRDREGASSGNKGAGKGFDEKVSTSGKQLPKDWKRIWSNSKNKYYYANTITKKAIWKTPSENDR